MNDLISRQAAIERLTDIRICLDDESQQFMDLLIREISDLPSAEREKGEWTTEEVAEILARALGDECACNFNGIDEWLPSACKYADTECPTPKEKHGCWIQFLMQGGADMRTKETDNDYERAVDQLEHDISYEPTFNQDDGSM